MMATDVENTIKDIVSKIGHYIDDAATLNVETRAVDVAADPPVPFEQARPLARSSLSLDGDVVVVVPIRQGAGAPQVDEAFFELHERNVKMATEYRAQLLAALIGSLQAFVRRP
jgi:hypothetical protein